jgi:hypothetical protein
MQWRVWGARAAFLLIVAGAFQPFYLRMLTPAHDAFARQVANLAFRKTPGLREFMEGVRAHTAPDERIAIAVPFTRWDGGYAYAYTRSTYVLAGRWTVPLVDANDQPLPRNLAAVDSIAAWRVDATVRGFVPVWRGKDGVLLRRQR